MSSTEFQIGDCFIGAGHQTLVIAEVAQAHDGSLGVAHAFIDAIADAGANAVKLQTHIAAAETTPHEQWRAKFSRQDATRYDYWQRMEFSEKQWAGLKEHADERGILFLSSPFSLAALRMLSRIGVPAWKVASGEVPSDELVDAMAATGLPVLLSSGMSGWAELRSAVARVRNKGVPVAVFQCTTAYPCPPDRIGLNLIGEMRERLDCPAGLSDHSGEIFPSLAAASLGADMVEIHVTFSKKMLGPDVSSSLTCEQLAEMVRGIRMIDTITANPVDKDEALEDMAPLRRLFTKSAVVTAALSAGTKLELRHLAAKKPGTGIPASAIPSLAGRRLARDIEVDHILMESDLEPEASR